MKKTGNEKFETIQAQLKISAHQANFISCYTGMAVYQAIAEKIKAAKNSIYICLYKFEAGSEPGILIKNAIAEKLSQGPSCQIKVVINQRQFPITLFAAQLACALTEFNQYPNFQLLFSPERILDAQHAKYWIIDNEVFVLSGDPSTFPERNILETGILLDGDIVPVYLNDFQRFVAAPIPTTSSATQATTAYDEKNCLMLCKEAKLFSVCPSTFSPCKQALLTAIGLAETSVDIIVSNLNDGDILATLATACNRGVQVNIALTKCANDLRERFYGGTNIEAMSALNRLTRKKDCLHIRWATQDEKIVSGMQPGAFHAKFCCVDNQIIISGSSPMDKQGMENSREVDLVLNLPEMATLAIREKIFDQHFANGTDYYVDLALAMFPEQVQSFLLPILKKCNKNSELQHTLQSIANTYPRLQSHAGQALRAISIDREQAEKVAAYSMMRMI